MVVMKKGFRERKLQRDTSAFWDYKSSFTRLVMNYNKVYSEVDFESRLRVAFVVDYTWIGRLLGESWERK